MTDDDFVMTPEMLDELTNGRDEDEDEQQPIGNLHENITV